jgi:hypothetical protein
MGTFKIALYGQKSLRPGGHFSLTDVSVGSNANAFTDGILNCTYHSNYEGNVQADNSRSGV